MDIAPEDRIHPDTMLILAIEDTKGWMRLALKRPNRVDIANCATHSEKYLLENYGLIIAKDSLFKSTPKEKTMSVYLQTRKSLSCMYLDGLTKEKVVEDIMKKIQNGLINEIDEAKRACLDFMNAEELVYSRYKGD